MSNRAVLPSLREKKRYLAFEIISRNKIRDIPAISEAIYSSVLRYIGSRGTAMAGAIVLKEKYDAERQRGLIKVNHKYLDKLRASLCFIDSIDNNEAIVQSVGASGVLKKAFDNYIAR